MGGLAGLKEVGGSTGEWVGDCLVLGKVGGILCRGEIGWSGLEVRAKKSIALGLWHLAGFLQP